MSRLLSVRLLPHRAASSKILSPLGDACRFRVSFSAVLQNADNVLPCYAIVQQQLKPQVAEGTRRDETGWVHSLTWTFPDGREIKSEQTGRGKKEAKNAAARSLLEELATAEASAPIVDPEQNGAVAQWAIEAINRGLNASMELQEEVQQREEAGDIPSDMAFGQLDQGPKSHICTWSCSHLDGEIIARGSAPSAAESRRQTMAALYRDLPASLETVLSSLKSEPNSEQSRTVSSTRDLRSSEMNIRHNSVVQKLGIQSTFEYEKLPSGEFSCTVRWSFWDSVKMAPMTVEAQGSGRGKQLAKARACEEIMVLQGHLPRLEESFHEAIVGIQTSLATGLVTQAVSAAIRLMEDSAVDVGVWSIFLPEVLRAALAEDDTGPVHSMLAVMKAQLHERGGAPVELFEGLLNEASLSIRHYSQATSALETLRDMPLKDAAFDSPLEKEYFAKFRHLLALERHGGLMSGITAYEMDPQAFVKVPTVDVHAMEANMVTLTSTPESIADFLDGTSRSLRASDIVLMVPMEVVLDQSMSFEGGNSLSEFAGEEPLQRSTNWQHPEAWLGGVTNVKGNPALGEEVRIYTRRLSRFSSDVERLEDGTQAAISPITLGRQYKLFFIALETPLNRQLGAVRCLSRAQAPPWSEFYEGRKPSFNYDDGLRKALVGAPEEAKSSAEAAPRTVSAMVSAEDALASLMSQRHWCAVLTQSQKVAVVKALDQRLSIIQGPPGTGKTHVACAVIAAWVDRHAPMGERVLAVADSNVAADNLHTRLKAFGIESVRAGQGKDSADYVLFGDALRQAVRQAQVVVATCIGSGMEVLDMKDGAGNFQRVVIDECTQACEPAALVALGRMCEQAVLIGDHKQLPATVLSKLAQRDGLGISLFERMININGLEPTVLQEQRRMHSSIAEFPNKTFYNSQLLNAIEDSALPPVPGFNWPNPDCRVCFVDVSASSGFEQKRGFSAYNVFEAEAVANVLSDMLNAGVQPHEVGVLTAYLAQRQEIIRCIQAKGLGHLLDIITIDTVDGYQGMERDILLFSATRSNSQRVLGFLADPRRMNVMLTRARRGLVVFGNGDTLRHSDTMDSHWSSWFDWVDSKGAVIQHSALLNGNANDPRVASSAAAEHPTAQLQQPMATPHVAPPGDWTKIYSEEYQANYFWNQTTNQTQWETPLGFVEQS